MDPRTVAANIAAVSVVCRLRADGDPIDVLAEYLGDDMSSTAARLALALAGLCSTALDERPGDPDGWLASLALVGDIEDAGKDVDK